MMEKEIQQDSEIVWPAGEHAYTIYIYVRNKRYLKNAVNQKQ